MTMLARGIGVFGGWVVVRLGLLQNGRMEGCFCSVGGSGWFAVGDGVDVDVCIIGKSTTMILPLPNVPVRHLHKWGG